MKTRKIPPWLRQMADGRPGFHFLVSGSWRALVARGAAWGVLSSYNSPSPSRRASCLEPSPPRPAAGGGGRCAARLMGLRVARRARITRALPTRRPPSLLLRRRYRPRAQERNKHTRAKHERRRRHTKEQLSGGGGGPAQRASSSAQTAGGCSVVLYNRHDGRSL